MSSWYARVFKAPGVIVVEHHGNAARWIFQRMFIRAILKEYVI